MVGFLLITKEGSDEVHILSHITKVLTSVHDSIELNWHTDAVCAVGGEVQSRVLSAICQEDNMQIFICSLFPPPHELLETWFNSETKHEKKKKNSHSTWEFFKNVRQYISLKSTVWSLTEKPLTSSIR